MNNKIKQAKALLEKDGTTCNERYLGADVTFRNCSDGFIHSEEAYKEICK
jgi:hypothetical protein